MHLSEMVVAEGQVFMKERKNPRRVKSLCSKISQISFSYTEVKHFRTGMDKSAISSLN